MIFYCYLDSVRGDMIEGNSKKWPQSQKEDHYWHHYLSFLGLRGTVSVSGCNHNHAGSIRGSSNDRRTSLPLLLSPWGLSIITLKLSL